MRIRIADVFEGKNTLIMRFHSPVGSGTALWNDAVPKSGDIVDVEFDLDEVFSWGKNMTPSSEKTPKIIAIGDSTYITAELFHSENEECTALRLGDSTILIELDGPIPQAPGFVEIRAARIQLYPTNV